MDLHGSAWTGYAGGVSEVILNFGNLLSHVCHCQAYKGRNESHAEQKFMPSPAPKVVLGPRTFWVEQRLESVQILHLANLGVTKPRVPPYFGQKICSEP